MPFVFQVFGFSRGTDKGCILFAQGLAVSYGWELLNEKYYVSFFSVLLNFIFD